MKLNEDTHPHKHTHTSDVGAWTTEDTLVCRTTPSASRIVLLLSCCTAVPTCSMLKGRRWVMGGRWGERWTMGGSGGVWVGVVVLVLLVLCWWLCSCCGCWWLCRCGCWWLCSRCGCWWLCSRCGCWWLCWRGCFW